MEIAKQFKDINFIWFGHTPMMSIPASTRHLINHHPDNVILPGYVRGPIIEGAYMSADMFLFATLEETEGIVVLEALAARCPLLIRDIPVYADWLEDQVHVHKAKHVQEFCDKIRAFYQNELCATVEAGYQLAKDRSLDAIGQQLYELYIQVRSQA
jgi:1,2-diacylglycerol-3-alpha-glucose alpha-1,2-glucosyltransferase